ncbi:MAG: hypothetical protein ACK5MF_07675 [Vibrio sp.]|uniref:hypothetical protein n=1 Tax=Vibrio sp. TaxID=678 RepID=UPI003A89109C
MLNNELLVNKSFAVETNATRFGKPVFNHLHSAVKGTEVKGKDMLTRLSSLSQYKQWILFTGECPRPQCNELAVHQIHCNRIIHMKPSQSQSEITIVMKAIQSGNASAIVASGNIDIVSQKLLTQMASEHNCEVFFLEPTAPQFH